MMGNQYHLNRLLVAGIGCFVVGIMVGRWWHLPMGVAVGGCVMAVIVVVVVQDVRYGTVALGLAAGCCGAAVLAWSFLPQQELAVYQDQMVTVQGQVVSSPLEKYYLIIAPEVIAGRPVYSHGQLAVLKPYGDKTVYARGAAVCFTGQLRAPLPRTNPGGFAEDDYWATQGIFYQLKAEEEGQILAPSHGILLVANEVQQILQGRLAAHLDTEQYQLVLALLFGEKGVMDQEFYSLSQKLGIAHVFAVSGLHVGFIVAFVLGLLRLLKLDRTWAAVAMMAVILFMYCIMTNFTPSAMRAGIMAMLAMLANRWLRFKDMYTIIAVAALIILLDNPLALWAVGFQLSFVSTWGLLYFYRPARQFWQFVPWPWLVEGLAVATAASLASAPLVAYHFYMVALFSPLFNILVVPMIGILVPLLLLALSVSMILPFLSGIVFLLCEVLITVLTHGLTFFAQVMGTGHYYIGQPNVWGVVLYFALLIAWRQGWLTALGRTGKWIGLPAMAVLLLMLWWPSPLRQNQLVFLDVGQGSSAVAQLQSGQTVVFDGGVKADVTANYLRYRAVNHLDAVVLSHGDKDHSAGIIKLFQDFSVSYLILNEASLQVPEVQPILALARAQQTRILWHGDVQGFQIGAARLTVKSYGQAGENGNHYETVALWEMDGFRTVFPGDLPSDTLEAVIAECAPITLWVVPHHGSKSACYPGLYEQIRPQLAVISAGRDNQYGHPHVEVTEALKRAGIPSARTDQSGAITVVWTDGGLKATPFLTLGK